MDYALLVALVALAAGLFAYAVWSAGSPAHDERHARPPALTNAEKLDALGRAVARAKTYRV
jgi:hypothetical protein